MASSPEPANAHRALPHVQRVRRGWLFRDRDGCGWWVDDTILVNSAHRVVPVGHPSAQYRVFTPMVGARAGGRRIYAFGEDDDHRISPRRLARQIAAAAPDRPADR